LTGYRLNIGNLLAKTMCGGDKEDSEEYANAEKAVPQEEAICSERLSPSSRWTSLQNQKNFEKRGHHIGMGTPPTTERLAKLVARLAVDVAYPHNPWRTKRMRCKKEVTNGDLVNRGSHNENEI
jgi:hypothetical protein